MVFICVVLFRDQLSRIFTGTSKSLSNQTSNAASADVLDSSANKGSQAQVSSVFADESIAGNEINGSDRLYSTSLESAPSQAYVASGPASTKFGVVDVQRLIGAHQSEVQSEDARKKLLSEIKRIVAIRASAHGLALVFDSSGKSFSGIPIVLATNGVPDITDEVHQELSR
jgi:hypothetical protein